MADVEVYYFTGWDHIAGENVRSKRPATEEIIQRLRGEPILETRQIVDSHDLDGNGFLVRKP